MLSRRSSYYLVWEASYPHKAIKIFFSQFCDWFQISIFIAQNLQNVRPSWLFSFLNPLSFQYGTLDTL